MTILEIGISFPTLVDRSKKALHDSIAIARGSFRGSLRRNEMSEVIFTTGDR
jgi:hypothetical protein